MTSLTACTRRPCQRTTRRGTDSSAAPARAAPARPAEARTTQSRSPSPRRLNPKTVKVRGAPGTQGTTTRSAGNPSRRLSSSPILAGEGCAPSPRSQRRDREDGVAEVGRHLITVGSGRTLCTMCRRTIPDVLDLATRAARPNSRSRSDSTRPCAGAYHGYTRPRRRGSCARGPAEVTVTAAARMKAGNVRTVRNPHDHLVDDPDEAGDDPEQSLTGPIC